MLVKVKNQGGPKVRSKNTRGDSRLKKLQKDEKKLNFVDTNLDWITQVFLEYHNKSKFHAKK